jgi:CheY-like chemotaxis protein
MIHNTEMRGLGSLVRTRTRACYGLILVLIAFHLGLARATDPYGAALDRLSATDARQSAGSNQEQPRGVLDARAAALDDAIADQVRALAQAPEPAVITPSNDPALEWIILAALAAGTLILLMVRGLRAWVNASSDKDRIFEQACSAQFLASFSEIGQSMANELDSVKSAVSHKNSDPTAESARVLMIRSSDKRTELLLGLRRLVDEIAVASEASLQSEILKTLCEQSGALKQAATAPNLVPLWQLACALEAFLKRAVDLGRTMTPTLRRTLANSVDLLAALSAPGVRSDLSTSPPIRLLAVDDDALGRRAVSLALKNALREPDLASDGIAALELARQHAYDAAFLDIEMPGMNGLELCAKLHELPKNRSTPVVFVTLHSDSETLAKSITAGGRDLISKPFVLSELSLKALVLVLRLRLRGSAPIDDTVSKKTSSSTFPASRQHPSSRAPALPEAGPV